jgi:hypothetical protein
MNELAKAVIRAKLRSNEILLACEFIDAKSKLKYSTLIEELNTILEAIEEYEQIN